VSLSRARDSGGVDAEMLAILRDPGPMTDSAQRGTGFLCLENVPEIGKTRPTAPTAIPRVHAPEGQHH
jgi:hypothetical protein